jgi:hypothetical protein
MASKRLEHRIDDALLAAATTAGFLYIRRRVRRLLSRLALTASVTSGLGALGAAASALAWQRKRRRHR